MDEMIDADSVVSRWPRTPRC